MSKKKFTAEQIVRIFREAEVLPGQVPGMPYANAKEGCRSEEKCLSFAQPRARRPTLSSRVSLSCIPISLVFLDANNGSSIESRDNNGIGIILQARFHVTGLAQKGCDLRTIACQGLCVDDPNAVI